MESALDSVVTVDDCYVYVRERCYELLRCKFLELDVLGILYDIFYCCVDTSVILELDDAFLCEEKECSCFVCNVIRNCYDCAIREVLKNVAYKSEIQLANLLLKNDKLIS